MQSIADLYKIGLSSSQAAVSQFIYAVKSILLKKFIQWPSKNVMDKYAEEFESLHNIPYVVGAVDGSHIPIVAPRLHAGDYYNRKGFYSVLLQAVVSSKCLFWDFDIGWAGSMHDANLWALDRNWAVLRSQEALAILPSWRCGIFMPAMDVRLF